MSITEAEAVAGLRILVAVAKADGTIHDDERTALTAALEGVKLPDGTTVEKLLAEETNLDGALGAVTSAAARDEIYKSAFGMARADGVISTEEQKLLDRVREVWDISEKQTSVVARLFAETKDTVLPSNIQAITDAAKRAKEIREDVIKYSLLSAVLGAFPIPGVAIATDLAVVAVQVKMVRDIGQYHGHQVDTESAKSMLYGLGLGTGARMAVNNLVKLVPGWGSAFAAVTSFASTFALGKVMDKYFIDGKKADAASLKKEFAAAEKEGKAAYAEHKSDLDELKSKQKDKLDKLAKDLKDHTITQAAYEHEVAQLELEEVEVE
jgi:uncharacterized protein (DUF697 family)/uncharacterized tellurite resistance protein B-like protein